MRLARAFFADLRLAAARLRAELFSTLALIVVLSPTVAVWLATPLYAESASTRLLAGRIGEQRVDGASERPFGYLLTYDRLAGGGTRSAPEAQTVTDYLLDDTTTPLGATLRDHRVLRSSQPVEVADPSDVGSLGRLAVSSMNGFARGVQFVAGAAPGVTADAQSENGAAADTGRIGAALRADLAAEFGWSVGQEFELFDPQARFAGGQETAQLVLSGIWEPLSEPLVADRFITAGNLNDSLVVQDAAFVELFGDASVVSAVRWLLLLDADRVTTDDVDGLLRRGTSVGRDVEDLMRGTRVALDPADALADYQANVERLDQGLRNFALPALVLAMAIATFGVWMRWNSRRAELLLLRRRGVSKLRLLGPVTIEALVTTLVAVSLGLALAVVLARVMGRATTFLRFDGDDPLTLVLNSRVQQPAIWAALAVFVLQLIPAVLASRVDLAGEARTSTGGIRQPWWQRTRLDLVVVAGVALFAAFVLRSDVVGSELLDEPAVVLLPALTSLAVALVAVRLLSWLAGLVATAVTRTRGTSLAIASRRLARGGSLIAPALMLLVITGALAVYTGSLARTLDLQLLDREHHRVGAELAIEDDPGTQAASQFGIVDGVPVPLEVRPQAYDPELYGRVWGVERASRMARLAGQISPTAGGDPIAVNITAIDPTTFAQAAFWRDDYARRALPELMTDLTTIPDAMLLPDRVIGQRSLRIGDTVRARVPLGGSSVDSEFVLVGSFSQFPGWIPARDNPPAVVVLADLEARAGRNVARQVFYSIDDGRRDDAQTRADFQRLGIGTQRPASAADRVNRLQARPDRQGVFGVLSMTFGLSLALTVAALVASTTFGFSRQRIELGVLRAQGLSATQLAAVVGFELLAVGVVGIGLALATGLAMAKWYLPRLIGDPANAAPRLLTEIDWATSFGVAAALAALIAMLTVVTLLLCRRMRLFEATKVGVAS